MAHTGRDQEHLGIDTNIMVAYLDKDHPQHPKVAPLTSRRIALNPTVIHESYHTLVFKMKWSASEAVEALRDTLTDTNVLFLNQTKDTTRIGLRLAERYEMGGRDALILAGFLSSRVRKLLTFDKALIRLREIEHGRRRLTILSL